MGFQVGYKTTHLGELIPMSKEFIDRINKMGEEDSESDGIQIEGANRNLTILDFLTDAVDDNSNISNKRFKHDESYQNELDDQLK